MSLSPQPCAPHWVHTALSASVRLGAPPGQDRGQLPREPHPSMQPGTGQALAAVCGLSLLVCTQPLPGKASGHSPTVFLIALLLGPLLADEGMRLRDDMTFPGSSSRSWSQDSTWA